MNNSLLEQVKEFLAENKAVIEKDQFFCIDETVFNKMIEVAQLSREDRVLEVGPGLGFLTRKLASKVKGIITIEIDEKFKPYLNRLPGNVEVIYGNAYKLLNDKIFLGHHQPPTKTVSNIPFSQAQNMLHNYTNYSWYRGDLIWLAPKSLAEKVNKEPILGAYFKAEIISEVPKSAFYPQPKTLSAIIHFHHLPDPLKSGDFTIYLRRWLYNHEQIKVKNTLREGIINASKDLKQKTITKNQARELIKTLNIPPAELEKLTNNVRPEYYFEVPTKLKPWFEALNS